MLTGKKAYHESTKCFSVKGIIFPQQFLKKSNTDLQIMVPYCLMIGTNLKKVTVTASTVSVVDLLSATSSTGPRGSLTNSGSSRRSAGTSRVPRVRLDDEAAHFPSQSATVSNLVIPVEAIKIASDLV